MSGVRAFPALAAFVVAALVVTAHAPAVAQTRAGADLPVDSGEETGVARERAAPDSVVAPDSTRTHGLPTRPSVRALPRGAREIRADGLARYAARLPGVRLVGSGWAGHHASVARGALPATLSRVAYSGSAAADWLDGGVDLLASSALEDEVFLAPSGPDLSIWPLAAAGAVAVASRPPAPHGPRGRATLLIDVWPPRPETATPYTRLVMGTGSLDRRTVSIEHRRRARDGRFGLWGYYDAREGRAPLPGGAHELAASGGGVSVDLRAGWEAYVEGRRSGLTRALPFADSTVPETEREYVASALTIGATDGISLVEIFHGESWLGDTRTGGGRSSVRTWRDGARVLTPLPWPWLDAAGVTVERRAARGSLLAGSEEAYGAAVELERSLDLRGGRLALGAAVSTLGGDAVPTAHAVWTRDSGPAATWVGVELAGRRPTILESRMAATAAPSVKGDGALVAGSDSLEPERAVSLSLGHERQAGIATVGARGEVVRVMAPIILVEDDDRVVRPVNAPGQPGFSVALWGAVGDTGSVGGRATVDLVAVEALSENAPVPRLAVRAEAWVPVELFGGFVEARLGGVVTHESGLAHGRWYGLLEDARTSVKVSADARAGAARVYVEYADLFDADVGRIPGRPARERQLSLGFSWDFWN